MRFLRKNKINKTILVISDIHLGAGNLVDGKRNYLEDFHYDRELVDFLEYYSSSEYSNREIELIINGDLFDFLAVPFVPYFDDEFWSEEASLDKLKIICDAHPEVIKAFSVFLKAKSHKITYIIGNHDAEFLFKSMRDFLIEKIDAELRDKFNFMLEQDGEYNPCKGVLIKHGHEYEVAHQFPLMGSIVADEQGKRYFLPPWGSYYVTRVINKFKEERDHINAVRPIRRFIINGLIYDTLYTVRFLLANAFYFIMVRFIQIYKQKSSIKEVLKSSLLELELFGDYEALTRDVFEENKDIKCLIVGHTHEPVIRSFADGGVFINTGTWTNMYNLDFVSSPVGAPLTYAQIDLVQKGKGPDSELDINLNRWKGKNELPYEDY
tara:strand:+ start:247861 stop:249000 length:1140 start_codon:yes stop_codon:yes gene_type:complete